MTDQPQPTKKERREAARAERIAQEQASAEAAARKKRLGIFGGLLLAAVAVVAVAIAVSSSGDDSPKAGEVAKAAEVEKLYAGIPQDGITLGDPKAKATIIFFAEPKCPVCRNFDETELPGIVNKLVRTGKAKMVLRLRAFLGEDSLPAIKAYNGASLQNKMFQAVGINYANQGDESDSWLTDERIRELLGAVEGLDADKAIKDGNGSGAERLIAEAETLAGRYGSEGTPDVYVGKSENDANNVDPTEASVTEAVNEIAGK
ncbi:MAG: thioredoxin domain-containing protein [Baekduia sp.]